MSQNSTKYTKILWITLFTLFSLAAVFMIKRVLSPHKRIAHIIIRPSSTHEISTVAASLKKILFPIYMEKKGVEILPNNYPVLSKEISNHFSTQKPYEISIEILRIDPEKEQSTPCLKEIKKQMQKKKKNWNKKIFFSACTIDPKRLTLAIAEPLSN